MKVLLFSRYDAMGASSRIRSLQYLPALKRHGITVIPAPLFNDRYLVRRYAGKRDLFGIAAAYFRRIFRMIRRPDRWDLIWIEKELLPWIPAWFESGLRNPKIPYVVDYDDAIFHRYDLNRPPVRWLLGRKIDRIMQKARLVIAGNQYLADRAHRAGAHRVEILPTVIDLNRYPMVPVSAHRPFTIGWIGSPTTAIYLRQVESALIEFCRKHDAELIVIGAGKLKLSPQIPVDLRPWSKASEAAEIAEFNVGIMPLPDTPWARGKCGYKLIQYMGCGRPVIASGVSGQLGIIEEGLTGFTADGNKEWIDRLETLYRDRDLSRRMGENGRRRVSERYCLAKTAPEMASLLFEAAGAKQEEIRE